MARRAKRRSERLYRKTGLTEHKCALNRASRALLRVVRNSQNDFYSNKLHAAKNDTKATYSIINHLLNKQKEKVLPKSDNDLVLANKFADFFHNKIYLIRET